MALLRLRRPQRLVGAALGGLVLATSVVLVSSGRSTASKSVILPPASRRRAPVLSGALLAGGRQTLRFGGEPVVVDLWASWCGPCRRESPLMARLAADHHIRVVGIDVSDNRIEGRRFARHAVLPSPQFFDGDARIAQRLGAPGLPTAVIVDAEGRVAARLIGEQTAARLREVVQTIEREGAGRL